jgi:hypothetical protein
VGSCWLLGFILELGSLALAPWFWAILISDVQNKFITNDVVARGTTLSLPRVSRKLQHTMEGFPLSS